MTGSEPAADHIDRAWDVITTPEELESVIGTPLPAVVDKIIDHIDDICREFIARSPFCLLATSSVDGHLDISPKGDPPGFVHVIDEHHLVIPDRPGNRRVDSFHNLLRDDRIALIFLVPGTTETVRVSGRARIVRDADLLATLAVQGKTPTLATIVRVERAFMHCPKCMIRSQLWKEDSWGDGEGLTNITEAMVNHAHLDVTPKEFFDQIVREGLADLY